MRRLLLLTALVSGMNHQSLSAQSALESFDPTANGNVSTMLRQSDGKIIVAGGFWKLNPNRTDDAWDRSRLARLNPDGSLDTNFWAGFNGDVACAVLQPDGKVVVGGGFSTVHTLGAPAPVERNGLARLNPDGTLDTAFDPHPGGNTFPLPLVRTLALQGDGKIIVGGGFTSFQPAGTASPVVRNRIARLNTDGSLDTAFDPNANNVVLALLIQADGRIVIGGGFTMLQPNGAAAAVARQRIARLNIDGTIDSSFSLQMDNRVLSLTAQADGAMLVGGDFIRVTFPGESDATVAPRLIRLTAAGARDNSFDPVPNGAVYSTAVQADGRILVGGSFNTVTSRTSGVATARTYLARLLPDGAVDFSFSAFPSSYVTSFLIEPDGSVLIGGYFTRVQGTGGATSVERGRIARLQPNGALDSAFNVANLGTSNFVVRLSDGSTIYGGTFQSFGGVTRQYLARVAANGVLDAAFAPEFNGQVNDLVVLPDGKLLVGGAFTRIGTAQRQYLTRLNADGSVDTAFNPKPNGQILDIVLQTDGKILIGGNFTSFAPNDAATATTRNFVARLNADGTLDTVFDPSTNGVVNTIQLESAGTMLIGGSFTALRPNGEGDPISRSYLARLTSAGKVDTTLNISLDNTIQAIAVQADGKIILGGTFNNIAPSGATSVSARAFIARLNSDNTLDATFDPKANSVVSEIVPLLDGRIAIGGSFTTLQPNGAAAPLDRRFFAWLESDGTSPDARAYSFDGTPTALTLQTDGLLVSGSFTRVFTPDGIGTPVESQVVRFSLAGVLDTSFVAGTVNASGYVGAVAIQPDGRIVLGGSFENLLGTTNRNLTRVTTDGFPDSTFFSKPDGAVNAVAFLRQAEETEALGGPAALLNASGQFLAGFDQTDVSSLTGAVTSIARQSDGKILVAGSLTSPFGLGTNLFRFNADGSVDETFKPTVDLAVQAMAVQADGKILIGGDFLNVNATARSRIARLNADGTLETAYNPSANGSVYALKVLSDGEVLVGGAFTSFQPNGAASTTSRLYLARLNTDGTLDNLDASLNGIVRKIILQSDGKILIGGGFTLLGTTSRTFLARLNADGGLDTAFQPNPNDGVVAIAQQSDGKILVGGAFTGFRPGGVTDLTSALYLARLNGDGTLDTAFKPLPSNQVNALALQSDGRILVGGSFSSFQPNVNADPVFRSGLARLNADGTVDPGFNPLPDGAILTVEIFADNALAIGGIHTSLFPSAVMLVGGAFTAFSETPVNHLARLYGNGLVDVNFGLEADATVNALASQSDGAIVVAGAFTEISGVARGGLARVTAAGGLDETFNPNADGPVRTALVLPGGKVLVGGEFTTVGGAAAQRLALINADGSLDAGFTASVDGPVNAVVAQGDGKFVVAGAFATVNGAARSNLARVNADGSIDASFNPAPNGEVSALALQGDGRIVVGGAFTQIGGGTRRGVARLNANGTLDTAFDASTNGDVAGLALQYNGGLIVGGNFSQIGEARRTLVARLSATSLSAQIITVDAGLNAATLSLGGGSGDFSSVTFSQSADGTTWTSLGAAQRTGQPGQWRITGLTLPASTAYFLRAEGAVSSSRFGSSSSRQVIAQFFGATPAASFASSSGSGSSGGSSGDGSSGESGSTGGDGEGGSAGGSGSGSGSDSGGSSGNGSNNSGSSGSGDLFGVVNLSGRGEPLADEPLITGFVVSGDGPQEILLRAIGPGLTAFGVNDAMELPQLRVYDQAGVLLQAVGSWNGDAGLVAMFSDVGAFELDPASSDAAVSLTLNPGAYSVHVLDSGSIGGIALGEIYVVPDASISSALANVSLRGPVGAGDAILVAGFAVDREETQSLLIRGAGPSLAQFGVVDAVQNPSIRIFNAAGELVADNDDWSVQTGLTADEMSGEMAAAGAFAFAPGSTDSAVVVSLPRGSYTIQLSGGAPGTALIEIYSAP